MSSTTELQTWLNGTPTGGPNGDGRYPMTAKDGQVFLVYCPAAQALNPALAELPVELFAQEAAGSASAASTSASTADAARIAAQAAATNAANSATTASGHATTAGTHKDAAAASASTASTANTNAQSAKTAAETARDLAQDWASKAENSVVASGQYSALHWAAKAAASAASVTLGNYWTKTEADARFLQGSMTDISAVADNSLPNGVHVSSTNGGTGGFVGWTAVTFKRSTLREARLQFANAGGTDVPRMWIQSHHDSVGGGGWTGAYEVWHAGNITPAIQADTLTHRSTIPGSANLNSYNATGIHHQNNNANAASGTNYPVAVAGMLVVYASSVMIYQTYQRYDNGMRWHRSYYNGTWSAWQQEWNAASFNPATKADLSGATFTGTINANAGVQVANLQSVNFSTGTTWQMLNLWGSAYGIGIQNNTLYYRSGGTGFAWHIGGVHTASERDPGAGGSNIAVLESNGNFRTIGELQSITPNFMRAVAGNYGLIHRMDGSQYYMLMTASGQQYGSWNNLRPFQINMATGDVVLGHNVVVSGSLEVRTRVDTMTGGLNTQQILHGYGWSNGVPRWKSVLETDGSWSMYAYNTSGGAPSKAFSLNNGNAGTLNNGAMRIEGDIRSVGTAAALYSYDRTSNRTWAWYGTSDIFRLYNGAADIVFINQYGTLTATNLAVASAGSSYLRGNGTSLEVAGGPLYETSRGFTLAANGAAWIGNARTFVQSADPGAQAADGDLWIW